MIGFLDKKTAISLARVFERMDKDQSGGIDLLELMHGFQILGLELTRDELEAVSRKDLRRVDRPP